MVHVVEAGDTLYGIAQAMTGDGNRYSEILPLNPQITDPNLIEVGEMLNLPDNWTNGTTSTGALAPRAVVTGNTSVPATTPTTAGISGTIIKVALLGALAAGAYWYYGQKKTVRLNPQFEDDDSSEDESEDDEDEE